MHKVPITIDRSQHTVLVVDDTPATRYSTCRILRAAGFQILEAANGSEGLHCARAGGVSAVVLDVHLPDIDGFTVCRMLRQMPETLVLPVLHLSATYVESSDKVAGLNSGADAYLEHPVEPAVLVATLQALIRARIAEDQLRETEQRYRQLLLEREQAARANAERHSRTKDDFVAVLSHELRNPLNAILMNVHVLLRKDPSPLFAKGLDAIRRNAQTQARIISDILDVSRINSGKLALQREMADPAALLHSSMFSLSSKRAALVIALGLAAFQSHAAVQRVDFTLTGSGGETATGFISYDDAVVPNGQPVSGGGLCGAGPDNSINYQIVVTGGQVGPVTFNKADCASPPAFCNAPDFAIDVNFFTCSAGGATGNGSGPNTFTVLNGGNSSNLTFQSISAPAPIASGAVGIPTLSQWGMISLTALISLLALARMRRRI